MLRLHSEKRQLAKRSDLALLAFTLLAAIVLCSSGAAGQTTPDPNNWEFQMWPPGISIGMTIGVTPNAQGGYDGQTPVDVSGNTGMALLLRRTSGEDGWTGPTGWYGDVYAAPLAPGASYTWSNMYLWAQNYTPPGNPVGMGLTSGPFLPVPKGYRGHLVLDYVPESMNYAGPMEFFFSLRSPGVVHLPVPTVTDPLDGVRMHFTVTAPVPEPSALIALGFGLLPLGGSIMRRRLRRN